jgi:DNA-binding CsgD family transcriptional regulator
MVVQKAFPPVLHRLPDAKAAGLVRVFAANAVVLFVFAVFVAFQPSTVARHFTRADGADVAFCALVALAVAIGFLDVRMLRSLVLRPRIGRRPPTEPGSELTARELEIVALIADSYTAKEIAQMLCISPKTVDAHRGHILKKLGMRDRVALIRYAIRRGWVRP